MTLPRTSMLRNLLAMVAYGVTHPLPQPGRHPAAIHVYETGARTADTAGRPTQRRDMTPMSNTQGNTMATENRNVDVIAGLREVADFLEANPDLPKVAYSFTTIGSAYGSNPGARERLTVVAHALGESVEEVYDGRVVAIRGKFAGGVCLTAEARVQDLVENPPPALEYEPIVARRDDV